MFKPITDGKILNGSSSCRKTRGIFQTPLHGLLHMISIKTHLKANIWQLEKYALPLAKEMSSPMSSPLSVFTKIVFEVSILEAFSILLFTLSSLFFLSFQFTS